MSLKNWPYWLRGALIGLVVPLIGIASGYFLQLFLFGTLGGLLYLILVLPFRGLIANFFCHYPENISTFSCIVLLPVIAGIFSMITYALFGSVIGWIIDKIKSRRT